MVIIRFKIFDRDEVYLGNIKDLIMAKHHEEINGAETLEFSVLGSNPGSYLIEKGNRVVYKDRLGYWKEFIIEEIDEYRDSSGVTKGVYCESSFYETLGDYIEDRRPKNVTVYSALQVALEPTRWEVGVVDDLGTGSVNFYRVSAKEAVQKEVAKAFKGELRTRVEVSGTQITHRYVDLLARRGNDNGKRYRYSKDLVSTSKTTHRDTVVTALYGYGKGEAIGEGYGRRIDFSDIEWSVSDGDPMNKPIGQPWLGSDLVKEVWGRNSSSGKAHVFEKVEFDDIEDTNELIQATYEAYQELSQPKITYECKVIDLRSAEGSKHEGIELGDEVIVLDSEYSPELRVKARVRSHTQDLLNPFNDEIVLGNFIDDIISSSLKAHEHIDNFRDKQGVWDRSQVINNDGTINAQFLNNLVDELNTKMNSQGGYVYISEEGKGLITYDKPNPQDATMAIQLLGGAFRIAGSKLPNGEFDWRTFGDGNGFVADSFIGGLLKGGKVHFDLTNGTLLIGNSTDDYKLWFDGNNLHIKLGDKTIEETIIEIKQDTADIASDVTIVKQGITDANSDIDIMKNQISLKVEQEDIDKITIGGRNLLLYSQNDIEFFPNSEGTGTAKLMYDENIPYYRVNGILPIDMFFGAPDNRFTEPLNTLNEVTIGLEVRTATNASVSLEGDVFETMAGRWTKVYVTKEFGINNTKTTRVLTPYSRRQVKILDIQTKLIEELKANVTQIDYRNLQFEKGTKSTDHQQAPIETITNIESNKASLTILADSITQRVTKNELEAELKLEADNLNIKFESGDFPLRGKNYRFDRENFSIGGTGDDVVYHDDKKSRYEHTDGSYTEISAQGLRRYDAGVGKEYHHLLKIIKFSTSGPDPANEIRWIPLGSEFNSKNWSVALSISDSMIASSAESAIQRIALTQAVDSGGVAIQPRMNGGQWEFPILGYKTMYSHVSNSRLNMTIAGIMIVTA